jgi:hypothetical protein
MCQCSNWRERRLNGWLLMRRVIDYAKEKGLRRVYGDVLAENMTMLQMCGEFGLYARDIGSGMRRVVLDLENVGDDWGEVPRTIGLQLLVNPLCRRFGFYLQDLSPYNNSWNLTLRAGE